MHADNPHLFNDHFSSCTSVGQSPPILLLFVESWLIVYCHTGNFGFPVLI